MAPTHSVAEILSAGKGMTNKEIREWYANEVSRIPMLNEEWIRNGFLVRKRARKAWKIRHDARLKARAMMSNPKEVELLRQRDLLKYGNPDGPTFTFLVKENRKLGLVGDTVYEAIIDESIRTNVEVNKGLGLK